MVTAGNGSQIVPRNSSQFKVIPKNLAQSQENRGKKEEKTLRNAVKPSRNEDIPLRRSNRQIKPPVRLSDYVQVIYVK